MDDFALSTNALNNTALHQTLVQILTDKAELTKISQKYVAKTLSFVSIKNSETIKQQVYDKSEKV